MKFLMVFIGGGLGAMLRYATGVLSQKVWPSSLFPIGTFLSNIISSIIFIALITFWFSKYENQNWQLLLITGLCGGYSTFSTFAFETFNLFKSGHILWAVANVLVSVLVAVLLMVLISKRVS